MGSGPSLSYISMTGKQRHQNNMRENEAFVKGTPQGCWSPGGGIRQGKLGPCQLGSCGSMELDISEFRLLQGGLGGTPCPRPFDCQDHIGASSPTHFSFGFLVCNPL